MKIVEPSVTRIAIVEPYKKMEFAGRICYKSDSKIHSTSYKTFVKSIVDNKHLSVLEQESIIMLLPHTKAEVIKLLFSSVETGFQYAGYFNLSDFESNCIISGNVRAWYELLQTLRHSNLKVLYDVIYSTCATIYPIIFTNPVTKSIYNILSQDYIKQVCEYKDIIKHCYESFVFVTSRSVSHQLVRHRKNSISQSSQRYCNYASDKFNHSIDFILPEAVRAKFKTTTDLLEQTTLIAPYISAYAQAEENYFNLINLEYKPEVAREVLPNGTATTIMTTANIEQWLRVINLRCDSHAQSDIRELMYIVRDYIETNYKEKNNGSN